MTSSDLYLAVSAFLLLLEEVLGWFVGSASIFNTNLFGPLRLSLTSSNKNATTNLPSVSGQQTRQESKKFRQYAATLSATVGPFAVGTVLAWMSPALPMLLSENSKIRMTADQGSWVGSLIAIGAIFGSIPAGRCADIFGRKPIIACLAVPFVISWTMIYFATSVWELYAARLIAGSVLGGITATVPMYIGEIAHSSIRGELGSFIQVNVTLGILYVYAIGPFVNYEGLAIMCGSLPVIWFVLVLIFVPESPMYLWRYGRKREAEDSLVLLRGRDYDVAAELDALQLQLEQEQKSNRTFKDLISSRATIRAAVIMLGLLMFLSCSGINVLIFYAESIFKYSNSSVSPKICPVIIGVLQVVFTFASSQLVDRAGRRMLLLISDSVMAVCLATLGYFFWVQEHGGDVSSFGLVPLVSLGVYVSTFALGFGPIPGVMMGELFSPEFKGLAVGIVCVLASMVEFCVVKTYQNLLNWFQYGITFGIFAGCCCLGTVFVWFLVPETKNKTLHQIQIELGGDRPNRSPNVVTEPPTAANA